MSAIGAAASAPFARVRARIEREYTKPLPLAQLAGDAGCSPFHLLREFRRCYGVTPHAYQERLRLERARALLANHASTITAIALELGYAHHSHFSAAFRRAYGVTPRTFRAHAPDGGS
ncbi:MAG TPA: AraC family transcriptional regulator [Candidatus Saccharimonadia bacterium]|nr:AraC family transcriptional regulator [Candidatus Saccharimonadia bacterium]